VGGETRTSIIGLLDTDAQRTAVVRAVAALRSGKIYHDTFEFVGDVRFGAPACVVVGTMDPKGESTVPLVGRITRDHPRTGIIAVCDTTSPSIQQLMHLARAGGDEVMLTSMASLAELSAAVDRACARRRAVSDWQRIAPHVPTQFHDLFEFCFGSTNGHPSVEALANYLDIDRSTLASRLRTAGLPPARTILSWSRLLSVTETVAESRMPLEQAALRAGFSSASRLRAFTQRMVGMGPRALANVGAEYVFDKLFRVLAGDDSDERPVSDTGSREVGER
jgi:methylphosphotriester-DNA--protein-cysteine methyltransferase